jgi:hypothetical protein
MCDQELIFICSIPVLIEKETTVDCNITVIELNTAGIDPSMYGLNEFVNPEDNPFLNQNNFQEILDNNGFYYIRRHDFVSNVSYCGYAKKGSSEDDSVWTISKIVVATDGSTTTAKATNVKWSDRLTVIYS